MSIRLALVTHGRRAAAEAAGWAVVVCVLVLTTIIVRREFFPPHPAVRGTQVAPPESRRAEDWVALTDTDRRTGAGDAPVTIVVFSDFECAFCAEFSTVTFPALQARYGGSLALVFRHFPLAQHRGAYWAARAAECAGEQDAFWSYHDALFAKHDSIGLVPFDEIARDTRVHDLRGFNSCFARPGPVPAIEKDIRMARDIGARATPAFVINGWIVPAVPAVVDSVISAEVARATALR